MRCKWRTLITDHEGERRAPPNSTPLMEPRAWTQRTAGARSVSFPGPARRRSTDELPTPSATPRPVCLVRRELQRRGLAEAGRRTCLTCGDLNPPPSRAGTVTTCAEGIKQRCRARTLGSGAGAWRVLCSCQARLLSAAEDGGAPGPARHLRRLPHRGPRSRRVPPPLSAGIKSTY